MIQHLIDGVLVGAIYALGAIGLTMVMHMLRFANFSHAELLSVGAYAALVSTRYSRPFRHFWRRNWGRCR